jgi:hypothetical protein
MIREVHYGKVLDNDDPDKKGGLKVQVDTLEEGTALRGGEYIPPCFPFAGSNVGFFFLPAKGALVEVEVESEGERATEELAPRWRAVLYTDKDKVPSEFLSDQTNRAGIKWGSDLLLFDMKKGLTTLISSKVRLGEEDASHPLVRGDTYNTELSTFLDGLTAYLTAEDAYANLEFAHWTAAQAANLVWKNLTPSLPVLTDVLIAYGTPLETTSNNLKTGVVTWRGAITTFKGIVTAFKGKASTWLSTKCKTE